jgi:hypothetical protein
MPRPESLSAQARRLLPDLIFGGVREKLGEHVLQVDVANHDGSLAADNDSQRRPADFAADNKPVDVLTA